MCVGDESGVPDPLVSLVVFSFFLMYLLHHVSWSHSFLTNSPLTAMSGEGRASSTLYLPFKSLSPCIHDLLMAILLCQLLVFRHLYWPDLSNQTGYILNCNP